MIFFFWVLRLSLVIHTRTLNPLCRKNAFARQIEARQLLAHQTPLLFQSSNKMQFDRAKCTCQASTRALKSWLGTTFVFGRIAPVFGLVLWSWNHSTMLARSYLYRPTVNKAMLVQSKLTGFAESYVKPSAAITGSRYNSMLKVLARQKQRHQHTWIE